MSVLAFDPYFDDTSMLAAKVAKVAKHEEIRQFPGAELPDAVAKAAKLGESTLATLAGRAETLAPGNPQKTSTLATLAGLAISKGETLKRDGDLATRCARCGYPSRPFIVVVNPDLWECDACLPADPASANLDAEDVLDTSEQDDGIIDDPDTNRIDKDGSSAGGATSGI